MSNGEYIFSLDRRLNQKGIIIPKNARKIVNESICLEPSVVDVYFEGTIEDWCKIEIPGEGDNPMYYAYNFYILDSDGEIDYDKRKWKRIKEIVIPSSISKIGKYQFYNFNFVEKIIIPDSVVEIGECAFTKCENLLLISLSKNLKWIGEDAFAGDSDLSYVFYNGTKEDWKKVEFKNKDSNPREWSASFLVLDENGKIKFNNKRYSYL